MKHLIELLLSVLEKIATHFAIKYLEKLEAKLLLKSQSKSNSKDAK